jgi:hypothetical protein
LLKFDKKTSLGVILEAYTNKNNIYKLLLEMVSDNIININKNKISKIKSKIKNINALNDKVISQESIKRSNSSCIIEENNRKNVDIIKPSDKIKINISQKAKIIKQNNPVNPFINKKVNFIENNCDLLNKIKK